MKKIAPIVLTRVLTSTVLMLLVPLAAYSETSSNPEPIGTAECGQGRGGERSTRPIQAASLEPRLRGYDLRLTVLTDGQPEEHLLELDNNRVVESARTLTDSNSYTWSLAAYNGEPLEIQPSGEFDLRMMVSTRTGCHFSGTLEFTGDTQSRLFPNSSTPRDVTP